MLTDFGYVGDDGIEYATETEADEAEKEEITGRAARPPPFPY